ncbi:hypothetical protein A2U01_0106320, partial [Trifolium medium]|nr:hypothetical protein [Trifolium medium]
MCESYLNFEKLDCKEEFHKMKGAHTGFKKLMDLYLDNLNLAQKVENDKEAEDDI